MAVVAFVKCEKKPEKACVITELLETLAYAKQGRLKINQVKH